MSSISSGTTLTTALVQTADTSGVLQLQTNGATTAVTIDTNQNVGVGLTSPTAKLHVQKVSPSAPLFQIDNNISYGLVVDQNLNVMVGTSVVQSGSQFRVYQASGANTQVVDFASNAASFTGVIQYNRMATTGSTSNYIFAGQANGTDNIYIYGNGNIVNRNNSYGTLSDIKLKENIVDTTPKLDDVMKLKVRNFNLKSDPEHKQIGFVAQELEQVFPAMIDESPDFDSEGNNLGTLTKSIKTSVLVPILVKAIQELSTQVTTLQAQVTALKG